MRRSLSLLLGSLLLTIGLLVGAQPSWAYPFWAQQNYDSPREATGKVVRGPAPLSLALAHVNVENDNVFVSQWTETDFRNNEKPWWA